MHLCFRVSSFVLIIFSNYFLQGQTITISGYLRDQQNGENLIGATIQNLKTLRGTATNGYGFYSLTLPADSVVLRYSYVGFDAQTIILHLRKDTVLSVALNHNTVLDEVVVNADRAEQVHETSRMGTITVPVTQLQKMPVFMGESDIIKILQLLPGVQGGSEGNSGLYVRGGGPDQNLILLDGVPVYNASHLYGFFSTFNADAINHVELVKGGFPARYGGRLSSVVDISMKEGNQSKLHGQASIGIISSKFMLEGPIKKNRTSFLFSARRSYLNLLNMFRFQKLATAVSDRYYFYDLNFKINHKINPRNRVYLSSYSGADLAGAGSADNFSNTNLTYSSEKKSTIGWGNTIVAARWNHIFSDKLFSNFAGTFSQYNFRNTSEITSSTTYLATSVTENQFYDYQYRSGIKDWAAKLDLDFVPNPSHYIRFGAHAFHHQFTPGVLARRSNVDTAPEELPSNLITAKEFSAYVEDDWQLSSKLKVNAGVHASAFKVKGATYPSLQPRLAARYLMGRDWSLKASYAMMRQFIHLLTNAGVGLPTDLWVPATATIKPQGSQQWAIGAARTFKDEYEISVEAYYKKMDNLIEYKEGASYLNTTQDWQEKVETGRGESYGAEWFMHKKFGKVNGWVGYTLSWTNRQFDNINEGRWFPYRYDRRHDAKIAASYTLNERMDVGLTWVYGTGNAITVPFESYKRIFYEYYGSQLPSSTVGHYENRNNFRMRDYHRLDINASYRIQRGKVGHAFVLSVYNAYARRNPFYVEFGYENNNRVLRQVSLFSIMPSLNYTLKF